MRIFGIFMRRRKSGLGCSDDAGNGDRLEHRVDAIGASLKLETSHI